MTTRPRRPARTRADGIILDTGTTPAPIPAHTQPAPVEAPTPAPAGPVPVVDRLVILDDYAGPDGLLPVRVAISHDAVFEGQHIRVPVTDRVAGLVERGFLEVEFPEPDWQ